MSTAKSPEASACPLLALPGELHNKILQQLGPMHRLLLRATCRYFRTIIPPLNLYELLAAEASRIGMERKLYACSFCHRLRPATCFDDSMKEWARGKGARDSIKRFCLDCGVRSPPGRVGYGRGDHIRIKGALFVICFYCTQIAVPGQDEEGKNSQWCTTCWARVSSSLAASKSLGYHGS